MDYAELCRALEGRLGELLSEERAGHSRRVAALAAELCAREGLEPELGRAAGLAHDLCKEMPKKTQRELAASFLETLPGATPQAGSALMQDKVMHGPASAFLIERDYGVEDPDLLEAVAVHTVGRPGMSGLSVILYCSDKLEPGRERIDPEYRRRCLSLPLDSMLLAVVEGVIRWMRSQGRDVAPETLILYSSLQCKAVQS